MGTHYLDLVMRFERFEYLGKIENNDLRMIFDTVYHLLQCQLMKYSSLVITISKN